MRKRRRREKTEGTTTTCLCGTLVSRKIRAPRREARVVRTPRDGLREEIGRHHKEYRQKKTRKNRTKKISPRNLPERFPHSPVRVARLSHEPAFRATALPSITMYITLCITHPLSVSVGNVELCDDKKNRRYDTRVHVLNARTWCRRVRCGRALGSCDGRVDRGARRGGGV